MVQSDRRPAHRRLGGRRCVRRREPSARPSPTRSSAPTLDLDLDLDVEVPLTRYPIADAVGRQPAARWSVTALLLVAALARVLAPARRHRGSGRLPRRGRPAPGLAHRLARSGSGAIDLAGSRGIWPHAVGEAPVARSASARCCWRARDYADAAGWLRPDPAAWAAAVPPSRFVGLRRLGARPSRGAGPPRPPGCRPWSPSRRPPWWPPPRRSSRSCVLGYARSARPRGPAGHSPGPARRSSEASVVRVLLGDVPAAADRRAAAALGAARPADHAGGARLPGGGAGRATGSTRSSRPSAAPLVQALVAGLVGAVVRRRRRRRRPRLRHLVPVACSPAASSPCCCCPLAVGLQRMLRRLVYGDREFPQPGRVRPAPAGPADRHRGGAAGDAARCSPGGCGCPTPRSRSSRDPPSDRIADRRSARAAGQPVTVELVVGGTDLGRLRLEVDPQARPVRAGRPAPARGRRQPGRRAGPGGLDQPRAPALAAAPGRGPRGGAAAAPPRPARRARARRSPRWRCGWSPPRPDRRRPRPGGRRWSAQLSEQARDEIAEVRRLVDGLRPPALDQFGLVSALRQRADEHNVVARRWLGAG